MRTFFLKNVCIIISLIIVCIIFTPFLWFWIGTTSPTTDLITAIITVLIGIISISFPIIIGNTAQRLSVYNNKHIALIFQDEPAYKRMLHIIPILIGIIIAFFFFSYSENIPQSIVISRTIALAAIVLCVYALIVFKKFWSIFLEYNLNTDSVILHKITDKVQRLLIQQRPSIEYLEYMDIYYQILYTKLKAESYIDLIDVQKKQSDLILGVLSNYYPLDNHDNPELNNNLNQLFYKYYLSTYLYWRKSFRENADATREALLEYYRVLNEVLYRSSQNYQSLFFLYQRIAGDLTIKDAQNIPHCRTASWEWYMNMLSGKTININLLYSLDQQILAIMSIIIQNGNQSVFASFIAYTIDGCWLIKETAPNIPSDKDLIEIMEDIELKLPSVFFMTELSEIKKLIEKNVQDEAINQDLQKYIQGFYKYNHVRLVVIIIGAYCLFKKRYDYIDYILHYNQPSKGQTHFLNEDIIPEDINILLKLYAETPNFMKFFPYIWEDHNDGQYWFKRFIALLACPRNAKTSGNTYYRHHNGDNKQKLEYYKFCISEMRQYLSENRAISTHCGISVEQLDEAQIALHVFSSGIRKEIARIHITQSLSKEKIKAFKDAVLNQISKNSIWATILTGNPETDNAITLQRTVGYNITSDKSFLSDGDTGLYIDFEQSFAKPIVYQINFFIERCLRFRSLNTSIITKSNFKDKIFVLDDSWIVLFFNYNIIRWLSDKPDFEWSRDKAYLVGTTSKGTKIYSGVDTADRSSRVFIFKRDHISKITGINTISIDITDLAQNEEIRNQIIKENPNWLAQYNTDSDKQENLKKNILVRITGEVIFSSVQAPEVYVFDNI